MHYRCKKNWLLLYATVNLKSLGYWKWCGTDLFNGNYHQKEKMEIGSETDEPKLTFPVVFWFLQNHYGDTVSLEHESCHIELISNVSTV